MPGKVVSFPSILWMQNYNDALRLGIISKFIFQHEAVLHEERNTNYDVL